MQFFDVPTDFTRYDLAEWLEVSMLVEGVTRITVTEIEAHFPQNQRPDAAELEQLLATVRERAQRFPDLYPYRAPEGEVVRDADVDSTVYDLLLVLSVERAPFRVESRFSEANALLEIVTKEALLGMLGAGAEARRFGWPSDDGRPEYLGDAVEWLAGEMGLQVGVAHSELDGDDKDGGIDVVAWHPITPASGAAFPVWMVQVTTEITFERKPGDVLPDKWQAWLTMGRSPQSGLAIPFHVPPNAKVFEATLKYSTDLLLERFRLLELISTRDLGPHRDAIRNWTQQEIGKILAPAATPAVGRTKPPRPTRVRRPVKPRSDEAG